MANLSVYIMAQDEERRIGAALESIRRLADEIVVIDGGSTDRTVEICRAVTPLVYSHPFEGYALQRQFAMTKVTGDWVLAIDADETLSPELRDAIPGLLSRMDVDAFEFSRRNYVRPGVWLRYAGMYPDYQRRLFRRTRGVYGGVVHAGEVPVVPGKVESVNLDILHDQVESNIQYHWAKLMKFVRAEVRDTPRTGSRAHHIFAGARAFITICAKKYFMQQGYRMGFLGVRVAVSHALLQMFIQFGIAAKQPAREASSSFAE